MKWFDSRLETIEFGDGFVVPVKTKGKHLKIIIQFSLYCYEAFLLTFICFTENKKREKQFHVSVLYSRSNCWLSTDELVESKTGSQVH